MKASRRACKIMVGLQLVQLEPGQLVFGRKSVSEELNLSESKVYRLLKFLESAQNLTIKPNNKFSLITITNWHTYQDYIPEGEQQPEQQVNTKRTTSEHKQEVKKERIKEVKKKQLQSNFVLPEWVNPEIWEQFRIHRKNFKPSMTTFAESLIVSKLEKFKTAGSDPNAILLQSIEKGWKGVFEIQGTGMSGSSPQKPQWKIELEEHRRQESEKVGADRIN